jgi:hypothetical protein
MEKVAPYWRWSLFDDVPVLIYVLQIDKMGKQRQLDTEAITGNPNLKTSL